MNTIYITLILVAFLLIIIVFALNKQKKVLLNKLQDLEKQHIDTQNAFESANQNLQKYEKLTSTETYLNDLKNDVTQT